MTLLIIIIVFSGLYFLLISTVIFGIFRAGKPIKSAYFKDTVFISIIISIRNEEKNIRNILDDIEKQNFNKSEFELIIIDDSSEDLSYSIAENYCSKNYNFRLLKQDENKTGKKAALTKAIKNCQGELIIATDADCRVGRNWLSSILENYRKTGGKMIICPVKLSYNTIFEAFQSLEFMSISGITVGSAGLNSPVMCNGANLVYEKKIFTELQNPFNSKYTSGDDMFLMMQIKNIYSSAIHYNDSNQAIVKTKACNNFRDFIAQRLRWASKGKKGYSDFFTNLNSFAVVSANLLIPTSFILFLFAHDNFITYLIPILLKFIAEFVLTFIMCIKMKEKKLIFLFPILFFIYPFYILFIGILSIFFKPKWKGRQIVS